MNTSEASYAVVGLLQSDRACLLFERQSRCGI
jgi:hypothetical protein